MKRTSLSNAKCPIALALDSVGDWWSMLIMRDLFQGLSRFDELQKSFGVAPNILTRRLELLVERQLLEKRAYSERPLRHDYVLTERGRDFFPVLMALSAWGSRHIEPADIAMRLGSRDTMDERFPAVTDAVTGERLSPENTLLLAGPAADETVLERIALIRAIRTRRMEF